MKAFQRRRLEKLADLLEQVPRARFDMGEWADGNKLSLDPECRTSACAWGWATVAFPRLLRLEGDEWYGDVVARDGSQIEPYAFFGLRAEEEFDLFYGPQVTPKQKARQIRALLKEQSRCP